MATDLFEDNTVFEVTLTGPLSSLFRHKEDEQGFPFLLKVDGKEIPVMASARGNSRKRVCYFPPIKLEFDQAAGDDSIFSGQKSLKLVTHCNKSQIAQDNLIEEFIAYRIVNLLTDASYRVRLLDINYIDTENRHSTQKLGFVIESNRSLAHRNNGHLASLQAVSLKQMNDQQLALVYIFQYLIGNTDWSLVAPSDDERCCHNGKLIERNAELFYIPYDFDLSGLVNAKYAFPDPTLGIKRVTQRKYRGFCLERPALVSALQNVKSHESDYADIIDGITQLSESAKKKAHRYLQRFFKEARDEQQMLNAFEKSCLD